MENLNEVTIHTLLNNKNNQITKLNEDQEGIYVIVRYGPKPGDQVNHLKGWNQLKDSGLVSPDKKKNVYHVLS